MCVFELVLGGDEEGGEVLGKEAGEGGGVSQQDLNTSLPCNMMLNNVSLKCNVVSSNRSTLLGLP